jgi:transcriptional regulator with GAF, ATPase, and Fis domain
VHRLDDTVRQRAADLNEHHPALARAVVQRASSSGGSEREPVTSSSPAATKGQRQRVCALLTLHGGNVSKVATELGKPRAQVYRWMRLMGLSAQSFRLRSGNSYAGLDDRRSGRFVSHDTGSRAAVDAARV